MKITMTSMISGKTTTRDIDVEPEQVAAWQNGVLIQDAMPELSAPDREFIMSGITQEEWEGLYPDELEDALVIRRDWRLQCGTLTHWSLQDYWVL